MSRGPKPWHSQQPPGVVKNWSTLQCSKDNTEHCGYDHAPVTRGRMRAQFPLPHGPDPEPSATWREVAAEVQALLPRITDVWWAALPELGEVWATVRWPDVLRRVGPGLHQDLLPEVAPEAGRLAEGWEHGCLPRLPAPPPPCRLPLAGYRLLPRPPPPPASRRAYLGPVTSADHLTTVQRAHLAQELWLTCRHALLPPPPL